MAASPFSGRERRRVELPGAPVGLERGRWSRRRGPGPGRACRGGGAVPSARRRPAGPPLRRAGAATPAWFAAGLEHLGEGQGGAEVIGHPRQRLLEEPGRLVAGTPLQLEEPHRLHEGVGRTPSVVDVAGLGHQHLREPGAVPGPSAEGGERADGLEVPGVELQHALVVGSRLLRVAGLLGAHPGQPEVERRRPPRARRRRRARPGRWPRPRRCGGRSRRGARPSSIRIPAFVPGSAAMEARTRRSSTSRSLFPPSR